MNRSHWVPYSQHMGTPEGPSPGGTPSTSLFCLLHWQSIWRILLPSHLEVYRFWEKRRENDQGPVLRARLELGELNDQAPHFPTERQMGYHAVDPMIETSFKIFD